MDALAIYRKALEGVVHKAEGTRASASSINQSIQKKFRPNIGEHLSLPSRALDPIQDLDPESETFGEFFFMVDVDPVDGDRLVT